MGEKYDLWANFAKQTVNLATLAEKSAHDVERNSAASVVILHGATGNGDRQRRTTIAAHELPIKPLVEKPEHLEENNPVL